jgi:hypothetical protein
MNECPIQVLGMYGILDLLECEVGIHQLPKVASPTSDIQYTRMRHCWEYVFHYFISWNSMHYRSGHVTHPIQFDWVVPIRWVTTRVSEECPIQPPECSLQNGGGYHTTIHEML